MPAIIAVQSGLQLENQRQLQTLPELAVARRTGAGSCAGCCWRSCPVPRSAPGSSAARRPLASGGGAREGRTGVVAVDLQVLLVAGAVAVLVCVFLTGDSGARALWGG